MNGSSDFLEIAGDHLNSSDQPQIIEEYQLDDDARKSEVIDLKPFENYAMISLDNPDGRLTVKHLPSSGLTALHRPPSTYHHNNLKPANATASVSHQSDVDPDCIQLNYQQVSELSSEVSSNDPGRAPDGLEDEMDCQIVNSKEQQLNEKIDEPMEAQNGKHPAAKQQEPAAGQAEATPSESKTRTVTLKLPLINGQKQQNLVLKMDKDSQEVAAAEKSISPSSPLKLPAKTGTTKPTIQTINPPKLIIKPLTPPADLATNSASSAASAAATSDASNPLTSTSTSRTNDTTSEKLKTKCLQESCRNLAIKNEDWEEFCSADCLIAYCKICFKNWVASRQKESSS